MPEPSLVVCSGPWRCLLPVSQVVETFRPLACTPVAGAPPFVMGLSVIRGEPTPVVHLGLLLGAAEAAPPRRFVSLRLPSRPVVLAVDDVVGLVDVGTLPAPPALLGEAYPAAIEAVGAIDGALALVLEATRVLPPGLAFASAP